jgi:hypothetical protein
LNIFSTYFVWDISNTKKNWARYFHNCEKSLCKLPVILLKFLCNLKFSTDVWRKAKISNFFKIFPVESELYHADGRMDMTLIVASGKFAPQTSTYSPHCICVFCINLKSNSGYFPIQCWLVFITEMKSVYRTVPDGHSNQTYRVIEG